MNAPVGHSPSPHSGERKAQTRRYPKRKYNGAVMAAGVVIGLMLGSSAAWSTLLEHDIGATVAIVAGSLFMATLMALVWLGNRAWYEIGPEGITFAPSIGRPQTLRWQDVRAIEIVSLPEAGWCFRIHGQGKLHIDIDESVPQVKTIAAECRRHAGISGNAEVAQRLGW